MTVDNDVKKTKSSLRGLTLRKLFVITSKSCFMLTTVVAICCCIDYFLFRGTTKSPSAGGNSTIFRSELKKIREYFMDVMTDRDESIRTELEAGAVMKQLRSRFPVPSILEEPVTDKEWIDYAIRHQLLNTDDTVPTSYETAQILERRYPNIPFLMLKKRKRRLPPPVDTCAPFPDYLDLKFDTPHWQLLEVDKGTIYVYSAHLDIRPMNDGPSVRVLAMKTFPDNLWKPTCQLWFKDRKEPVVVGVNIVTSTYSIYNEKGATQGFIFNCKLPKKMEKEIPLAVSLVRYRCDRPSNILKVTYNRLWSPKRKKFVVCSKGLHYPQKDISPRLVEWLEMLKILGADKVFLYDFGSHPNVTKTLEFYEKQGFVDRRLLTLPGKKQNDPFQIHDFMLDRRRKLKGDGVEVFLHETIARDDCLFRNMYQYEYLNYADPDSLIIPLVKKNWRNMIEDVHRPGLKWNSICFRCALFELQLQRQFAKPLPGIPSNMMLLNFIYRCPNYERPSYLNCFFNPQTVVAYGPHNPIRCFDSDIQPPTRHPQSCDIRKNYVVRTDLAIQAHYRDYGGKKCSGNSTDLIEEKRLWLYKDKFIPRVAKAYMALGLYNKTN